MPMANQEGLVIVPQGHPQPLPDNHPASPQTSSTRPYNPRRPDLSQSAASRSRPSPRPARSTSSLRTPRKLASPSLNPPAVDARTLKSSASTTYLRQDPFVPVFNLPKPVVCPSTPVANQWPPAPYGSENVPDLRPAALTRVAMDKPSPAFLGDPDPIGQAAEGASVAGHPDRGLTGLAWPSEAKGDDGPPLRERSNSAAPPSLTLSLFSHLNDPNLSWQRKLGCFGATLAINLFLPFMNGIMLGFGEIAAREIVGAYFGWGPSSYRHQPQLRRRTLNENTNRQSEEDGRLQSFNRSALFVQSELD